MKMRNESSACCRIRVFNRRKQPCDFPLPHLAPVLSRVSLTLLALQRASRRTERYALLESHLPTTPHPPREAFHQHVKRVRERAAEPAGRAQLLDAVARRLYAYRTRYAHAYAALVAARPCASAAPSPTAVSLAPRRPTAAAEPPLAEPLSRHRPLRRLLRHRVCSTARRCQCR